MSYATAMQRLRQELAGVAAGRIPRRWWRGCSARCLARPEGCGVRSPLARLIRSLRLSRRQLSLPPRELEALLLERLRRRA